MQLVLPLVGTGEGERDHHATVDGWEKRHRSWMCVKNVIL